MSVDQPNCAVAIFIDEEKSPSSATGANMQAVPGATAALTPTGLTAKQEAYNPDRATLEREIRAVAAYYEKLKNRKRLQAWEEQWLQVKKVHLKALDAVRSGLLSPLDARKLQAALTTVNAANAALPLPAHLDPRLQQHEAGPSASMSVDGNFPTTTTMSDDPSMRGTLTDEANATVSSLVLLSGLSFDEFVERHIRSDRVATCVKGKYEAIPKPSDYALYQPAHINFLGDLFALGVTVYTAISDSNRDDFVRALYGGSQPNFVVLVEKNGSSLELHMPKGKRPVVALFPSEHTSHVFYQALAPETRLWIAAGLVEVYAARAALLGLAAPRVEALLASIGSVKLEPWRRVGGAYCEAAMREKRIRFRAAHGIKKGDKLWLKWYLGCKAKAGRESGDAARRRKGVSEKEIKKSSKRKADAGESGAAIKRTSSSNPEELAYQDTNRQEKRDLVTPAFIASFNWDALQKDSDLLGDWGAVGTKKARDSADPSWKVPADERGVKVLTELATQMGRPTESTHGLRQWLLDRRPARGGGASSSSAAGSS